MAAPYRPLDIDVSLLRHCWWCRQSAQERHRAIHEISPDVRKKQRDCTPERTTFAPGKACRTSMAEVRFRYPYINLKRARFSLGWTQEKASADWNEGASRALSKYLYLR
jgi:hypothetical protein